MEPRNRFQGMNSASLCSLAGRYDNPIPPRFLDPIDSLKIPALLRNFLTWNKGAMRGRPPDSSPGGGCMQSAPTEAGRPKQIPAVRTYNIYIIKNFLGVKVFKWFR
jgi:hypothetical protein